MELIILTGGRPTGTLHLGHYAGAFNKYLSLQENAAERYFIISDNHFLTTRCERNEINSLSDNISNMIADCISIGITPEKTAFYLQSQIPELPELYVIIQNLVSVSRLKKNLGMSNVIEENEIDYITAGLLAYPVMEASDIISIQADEVVVGIDNIDHLKITNEIVNRLNFGFQCNLKSPICVTNNYSLIGLDGKIKMSKSSNNAIFFMDNESEIDYKISKAIFPCANEKGVINPIMEYICHFAEESSAKRKILDDYYNGENNEKEAKHLAKTVINDLLIPIRKKRDELNDSRKEIMDILRYGTEKARHQIASNVNKIKKDMNLIHLGI